MENLNVEGLSGGVAIVVYGIAFIVSIAAIIGMWAAYKKAGYLGIFSIIPVVQQIIQIKMAGWSGWLILTAFIPPVYAIIMIIVPFKIAKAFGKSFLFGLLLLLLPPVGWIMLGFGDAKYQG